MKNTIETKIAELKTEYQELTAELHADENISDAKDARIRKARREVNAEIETLTALYNSSTDPDFREQIVNKAIELASNAAEEISEEPKTAEMTIEIKTFESGKYSLKLNGKRVALKTFGIENGFYTVPDDTEIILNGRKLRYIGRLCELFDYEYIFADENGNGARSEKFDGLIWILAKFGTHDVSEQVAKIINNKKAYFVREKVGSEMHAIDAEYIIDPDKGEYKAIDTNVFNFLPELNDEDDADDELIDEPAEIEPEADTPEKKAEKIAALERGIKRIISERQDAFNELEDAEANDDIAQFVIDQLKNEIDALNDEYWEYVRELEELQKSNTPAEVEQATGTVTEPTPEPERTKIQPADALGAREVWLSQYWPIDTYIHAEDDDGNEVKITQADITAIENSLRGKYYLNATGDGVEFFAEDCTASLLSAICTELEDRGCIIEDYHEAWEVERAFGQDEIKSPVIEHMNRNAPDGWSIKLDGNKIRVEYQGNHIADVGKIEKRDELVPQAFFDQFVPMVDETKTPEQMFLDDRYRELAELEEMRKSPDCTPAAIQTLDEMIARVKRDIVEAEFHERDTVAAACKAGIFDEDGNLTF